MLSVVTMLFALAAVVVVGLLLLLPWFEGDDSLLLVGHGVVV